MLEQKIDNLTNAITRLCDVLQTMQSAPKPAKEVLTQEEKEVIQEAVKDRVLTPGEQMDIAEEFDEEVTTVAEAEAVKEAAAAQESAPEQGEIPTVEELQERFGKLAEKYGPGWVIAGIKHFGHGRLSDLSEADRANLSTLMSKVAARLAGDADLPNKITPVDLIAEVSHG